MSLIDKTTICAISTAPGTGAIALIRLSGGDAIKICESVFKSPKEGKKLADQRQNTIHFGHLIDKEKLIDEVMLAIFHAPNSYTGEDIVEISCHGSSYIQQKILQLLINKGHKWLMQENLHNVHFLMEKWIFRRPKQLPT